jgi:SagB-type dehydrogenase family enzyme
MNMALLCCAFVLAGPSGLAEENHRVELPAPQTDGGKPIMVALRERKTSREFSAAPLPKQALSNLLWAAFGVNRPETGHRTAPSAMNAQEIEIYVASAGGLYLYEALSHQLKAVMKTDLRPLTGARDAAGQGPVVLIFVADFSKMVRAPAEQKPFYAAVDTGCISQNVYLYCASEGLATVVHDLNRPPLAKAMNLRPEQHIVLAQTVGLPKDSATVQQ